MSSPTASPTLSPVFALFGRHCWTNRKPYKEGASMFQQRDSLTPLPMYAKVLFTFAIISVSFAILWFTYRKIVKPRLVLKRHMYSSHSDADSEGADLTGALSPMADGNNHVRGSGHDNDDDDEWAAYGATNTSAHTPVPVRSSRRTPLSAQSGAHGRNFRTPLGSSVPFITINGPANKGTL